jgi:hypothetical protein
MDLSRYSNILGEPGKGIHTHVLGIALADVFLTFVLAGFFYWLMPRYSYWVWLVGMFLLGILLHRVFGVRTVVDRWLFG